jgi:hypothetical protein
VAGSFCNSFCTSLRAGDSSQTLASRDGVVSSYCGCRRRPCCGGFGIAMWWALVGCVYTRGGASFSWCVAGPCGAPHPHEILLCFVWVCCGPRSLGRLPPGSCSSRLHAAGIVPSVDTGLKLWGSCLRVATGPRWCASSGVGLHEQMRFSA